MGISLLPPLLLLLAAFLLYILRIHTSLVVRRWPTTGGKVLSAKVRSRVIPGNSSVDSFAYTGYRANVVYEYVVDGKRYQGNRVASQGGWFGHRRSAARIADRYAKGSTVRVYYDRNKPGKSLISPDVPAIEWIMVALLLFVALVWTTLLIFG